MRRSLVSFIAVICLSITFSQSAPAFACSGPALPDLQYLLDAKDTIVTGQFVDLDDQHLNGILQVKNYLYGGSDAQNILISVNKPVDIDWELEDRNTGGQCSRITAKLELGEKVIGFLKHEQDGSYTSLTILSELPQIQIQVIYPDAKPGETEYHVRQFSFEELRNFIVSQTLSSPRIPKKDAKYPLKAPILITTNTNKHYLFPVDGSRLVKLSPNDLEAYNHPTFCNTPNCVAYSPNELDTATLIETAEIEIGLPEASSLDNKFRAKAVSFSSTSDALAVWRNASIEIYALFYKRLGYTWDEKHLVNSIRLTVEQNTALVYGSAAWSPDGRLLAYSDEQGLWLWDIFTVGSNPRLLIANDTNAIPYARFFSTKGRYLAVSQGGQNYNFDTVSNLVIPDGLISPDERAILTFDTTLKADFDVQKEWLAPANRLDGEIFTHAYQTEWIDANTYLIAQQDHGYATMDGTYVDEDYRIVNEGSMTGIYIGYLGTGFAYNHQTKTLVIIADDSKLRIDGVLYDLSDQLDAPITTIKWLPSIYYYNPP